MKTAQEMMTATVTTVRPEMMLDELARLFTAKGVSGFPVVDAKGALVGVVTESDLIHRDQRLHSPTTVALFDAVLVVGGVRQFEEDIRRMAATTVGEIMSREPVTIAPGATLDEIATLMGEKGVHTLPVVDEKGALVGIVGKRDLIRAIAR